MDKLILIIVLIVIALLVVGAYSEYQEDKLACKIFLEQLAPEEMFSDYNFIRQIARCKR